MKADGKPITKVKSIQHEKENLSEAEQGKQVAVMTLKDELIALGTAKMSSSQMLKGRKGLAVQVEKVFMLPGTYPKLHKV